MLYVAPMVPQRFAKRERLTHSLLTVDSWHETGYTLTLIFAGEGIAWMVYMMIWAATWPLGPMDRAPWAFDVRATFTQDGRARMRMPGVEPGSQAREACMIPLHYMRVVKFFCEFWSIRYATHSGVRATEMPRISDLSAVERIEAPAVANTTVHLTGPSSLGLDGDRRLPSRRTAKRTTAWLLTANQVR